MGKSLQYIIIVVGLIFALDIGDSDVYDNSWALVVGINDYQNIQGLNYAVEDALAIFFYMFLFKPINKSKPPIVHLL